MKDDGRAALRSEMRRRRRALGEEEQRAASIAVCRRLLSLECWRQARTVMAYVAAGGELSLSPLMDEVLASGRRLCLPRCEAPGRMTARLVRAMEELVPGAYGIPAPGESCPVTAREEIDLILVPGTAFDREGRRIGQGGGYYDRFLPGMRAVRVGICHDFALLDRVPARAHDQRMDLIAAPSFLLGLNRHDGMEMTKQPGGTNDEPEGKEAVEIR